MVKAKKVTSIENEFGKEVFRIRFVSSNVIAEENGTLVCDEAAQADFLYVAKAFAKSNSIRLLDRKNGYYLVRDISDGVAYGILFRKMFAIANKYKKEQISRMNKKRSIRLQFVDGEKIYETQDSKENFFVIDQDYLKEFLESSEKFENVFLTSYSDGTYGLFYGDHTSLDDIRLGQSQFDILANLYHSRAYDFKIHQDSLKAHKKAIVLDVSAALA